MLFNENMSNNHALQSMPKGPTDVQPDYRTLLLMKRNSSRPPAWKSFDVTDSDDTDGSDDDSSLSDSDAVNSQVLMSDEALVSEQDISSSKFSSDTSVANSDAYGLLKITVTEQRITKCMQVNILDSVWTVKQRVIQSLAKKLQDSLNYGFFCKRSSSFLLEHKLVSDYVEAKSVTSYELRYKRRVYHQVIRSARDSHRLLKMQGDAKRKELMRCIRQQQVEKIKSLMKKGVDPNFHFLPTGETPLIAVVNHPNSRDDFDRFTLPALKALLAGQAHLDFRNQQGYTPIHIATQQGNLRVLEALLGLGAHPDVLDNNDLSPLYHCALNDASTNCIRTLSEAGASLDCRNSQGWTLLHQVCRHGRLTHLEIYLDIMQSRDKKESFLNAQNDSGNTALHVCAIYKQEKCLVTLLRQGCDPAIRNFSHQDASQVAVVATNINLANLIKDFPNLNDQEISLLMHHYDATQDDSSLPPSTPQTNTPDRRHTLTSAVIGKNFLNRTLQRKNPFSREKSRSQINIKKDSSVSPPMQRQCNSDQLPKRPRSIANTFALTQEKQVRVLRGSLPATEDWESPISSGISEHHSDTDLLNMNNCVDSSYQGSRQKHHLQLLESGANEKSNHADTGYFGSVNKTVMHIACDSYEATRPQEISLKKGERVTVSALESFGSVVPEGFCKVTVGKRTGFVPKSCIQTVKLRKPQVQNSTFTPENRTDTTNNSDDIMMKSNDNSLRPTPHPDVFHQFRDVILSKGENGFGFVLRGAKADKPIDDFTPTPRQPGLQYLESVERNGNAHQVGLRADDFILKINGVDVTSMGHKQVVDFIRKIKDPIHLRVVSVVDREGDPLSKSTFDEKSSTTSSINDASSTTSSKIHPSSSQGNLSRSGSIRSALGKLDSVLAMEEGSADEVNDEMTATLRRRPISRRLLSQDLQGIFPRQDGADVPKNNLTSRESQSLSSATSRRLIRVVAPKLPDADNTQDQATANGSKAVTNGSSSSGTSTFAPASTSVVRGTSFHGTLPNSQSRTTAPASSSGAKKPPPPPPQRRSSRLSTIIPDDQAPPAQITAPPPPAVKTPTTTQSLGRGFIGRADLSNIAASVALQAQQRRERLNSTEKLQSITHNLISKPPPNVAPKPGRGKTEPPIAKTFSEANQSKSAFAIALAAKQANMRNRSQTDSKLHGPGPLKASTSAIHSNNLSKENQSPDLERNRMELPPPPPNNPVLMNLPPPPPPASNQSLNLDQMILPPPPDDLITENIPPPPEFSNRSVQQSLNGVDNISNPDSGVDELALNPRSQSDGKTNIETLSVVSSLSTVSSEEGSDAGVSLSYDPRLSVDQSSHYMDAFRKAKAADNADSSLVLHKVNFSAPKVSSAHVSPVSKTNVTSSTSDAKSRVDVTKLPSNSQYSEPASTKSNDVTSSEQKPLTDWTVDDVCEWLRNLGLGSYEQVFAENEIEGSHLPDLGKEDLLELGVTRVGHRLTIEKSLKKLLAK